MTIGRRAFLLGASQAAFCGSAISRADGTGLTAGKQDPSSAPMPTGAVSAVATLNGIRLHYVTAGSGPPVVLLHGWPQTWFAWRTTMERLAPRFTVIAPDLRGIGLSERTSSGYDKRTIAEDIRALIAHVADGASCVVGHDMGGKAAYALAHLHPACVSKLVLVDCLIPGTENADGLRGGAWHYGFHAAHDFPELLTQGRERAYISAQIRAWSHRQDAVSEDAITEYARHYASPGGMTAGFDYYRTLRDDAALVASFDRRRLAMPVLAITGRHGVRGKLADALKGRADDLTTIVAEDSGHFVAEETPDFFCNCLERFLSI